MQQCFYSAQGQMVCGPRQPKGNSIEGFAVMNVNVNRSYTNNVDAQANCQKDACASKMMQFTGGWTNKGNKAVCNCQDVKYEEKYNTFIGSGNDAVDPRKMNLEDCKKECINTPNCKGITHNGETCWFKSATNSQGKGEPWRTAVYSRY
jgi:hypothetical protein